MIQNRNITASPLAVLDKWFIISATKWTLPKANNETILPNNKNVGAPGGCPTSSLYEQEINSPQSQKLAVGSEVRKNTVMAVKPTSQPKIVLIVLKFFMVIFMFQPTKIEKIFYIKSKIMLNVDCDDNENWI